MSLTMRLLKCPACGGPLDPPAGESIMKCTYCGNAVVIPESLRLPKQGMDSPQVSIFSGIDMNAMVGYGAKWAEVVQLAQGGNKAQAIKKYMALTGNDKKHHAHVHVDWVRNHCIRYVHHSRHDTSDFDRRLRQFNVSFQVAETYSKQVWA